MRSSGLWSSSGDVTPRQGQQEDDQDIVEGIDPGESGPPGWSQASICNSVRSIRGGLGIAMATASLSIC